MTLLSAPELAVFLATKATTVVSIDMSLSCLQVSDMTLLYIQIPAVTLLLVDWRAESLDTMAMVPRQGLTEIVTVYLELVPELRLATMEAVSALHYFAEV